ncbi:metalloregulator ArsR/SmtB family transcription factor [Alcaligenes ammonioxydans]|jgi:DNA-binding transcriptional ArsR family regulator|uniref:Helix-turn-helix transcriptional regulator n=1 Tax=Alcaligenes ammonioxydans TaxID=2582914 RepID=A0ABX8SS46_9BURK|nr:metalloregulator ArsR/SmtB family transcription factor [Alcaligenes ammonioxydans]EJC63071.1 DNA-binding transcriptional regulator [Alcaligenes faecalis subsp. faecalis NCIB 8687]QBH20904.1 transcriptional regulator [Alcaligenes faecalis]MCH1878739.1 metalloregulator ArsR/SmtB family transcription factor [Alcaligenes ammonioxydans]QXX78858.1 helix-turn-helix transcriptional regulator [Alcaligenes ammonioxydans]WGQ37025.1 metalloregulator ArsR/SmtB family transcription factor [Alcaligenes fa
MIQRKSDIELLQESAQQAAALLQAVGNPKRLVILCLLIQQGEMSVGALNEMVALSPSALSQHLARMRQEGLVSYRRQAQTLYYRIEDPNVARLIGTLKDIFCP